MSQPDQVSAEVAYAEALQEIFRLQERLIMGRALIASLKKQREVSDGQKSDGSSGDGRAGDAPQDFSD